MRYRNFLSDEPKIKQCFVCVLNMKATCFFQCISSIAHSQSIVRCILILCTFCIGVFSCSLLLLSQFIIYNAIIKLKTCAASHNRQYLTSTCNKKPEGPNNVQRYVVSYGTLNMTEKLLCTSVGIIDILDCPIMHTRALTNRHILYYCYCLLASGFIFHLVCEWSEYWMIKENVS